MKFMVSCVTWFVGVIGLAVITAPPLVAAQQWSLATADTQITIGVDDAGNPAVYALKNAADQYNWLPQASPIPLPDSVVRNGQTVTANWQFQGAAVNTTDGTKLTLTYASAAAGLQYTTEWWARPGEGPIREASSFTNTGGGNITLSYQPTFSLKLTAPQANPLQAWHFAADGGYGLIDAQGVYREQVTGGFNRIVHTDPAGPAGASIPLAVLDSGGNQGVYVGTEWSYGDIQITGLSTKTASVVGGNVLNSQATLNGTGQVFQVPPGFVGAYNGNIDDAGNSLRDYLYNYNMPDVLRNDASYPKVQWNAFGATGKTPGSWDSVQSKYYPLINDIASLGFEEVMLDVGWWQGAEPNADPVDWASGMSAAAAYAHSYGIRFGLYWSDNADMTTAAGRATRTARIEKLFQDYQADIWRSDSTSGDVIASNYASVKGFYDMIDALQAQDPDFQWEDCSGGGRIKDYGALKRSVKIFNSDNYSELEVRKVFYDSSFALHPIQIEGHLGSIDGLWRPQSVAGMKYAFRSISMGAPEWFIDAPNGGNGTTAWTDAEKAAVASSVATFKEKIRPLIRNGDLYHVFPRPDGVVWDGIEYFDPETDTGVVYIFKPENSTEDIHNIILQGLDADQMYWLTFEDGTNPTAHLLGSELMSSGIDVTLYGTHVSELMFIAVPEPSTAMLLALAGLMIGGAYFRHRRCR